MRKLRQAGWVQERRYKYWTYYRLNPDLSSTLRQLLQALPVDPDEEKWLKAHQADMSCAGSSTSAIHDANDLLTVRLLGEQ